MNGSGVVQSYVTNWQSLEPVPIILRLHIFARIAPACRPRELVPAIRAFPIQRGQ